MPSFAVRTAQRSYSAVIERGVLAQAGEFVPAKAGKVFVVTTEDVWRLHGGRLAAGLAKRAHEVLFFPGGEERKRMASVEALAEEMARLGGDRTGIVIAFGGGIVNDLGGFLAAIFMRGIPVIQIPTTLLAQVDASVGGKTGANLVSGKNLVGAFHQPLAVLIDPAVLETLAGREYRAGLYEIIKAGIIRSPELFRLFAERRDDVLRLAPEVVDRMISESVRIKAEVVTEDEKESDLRRILNLGHTFGHALEAETGYARFLHGEAVAWGMLAAAHLATYTGDLSDACSSEIRRVIRDYGPIPGVAGIPAINLARRLKADKKTIQGTVHFVIPTGIGSCKVVSGVDNALVMRAIGAALDE